jgi:hypothetical protein
MTNTDTNDTSVDAKKQNPSGSYNDPADVLTDKDLSRDEKIAILREWYYDAMRLQESEGENMSGGEPDRLRSVSKALLELGVSPVKEADPKGEAKSSHLETAKRYLSNAMDALRGKGKAH